jgi:hypothetical protein
MLPYKPLPPEHQIYHPSPNGVTFALLRLLYSLSGSVSPAQARQEQYGK